MLTTNISNFSSEAIKAMLFVHIQKQLAHFNLDVHFNVNQEIVALLGPSGSGKTTILNCIAGLTKPDQGTIQFNKQMFYHNGKTYTPTQKRQVGYLFQDYALFPHKTVWENVAYGMKRENFAEQLLNNLRINHLKHKYPQHISGGEKQRVAIARALATEPRILLLDEPFSALDDDTRLQSQQELLRIHKLWRVPTILVTHSQSEANKLADNILYINDGKILPQTNNNELKTKDEATNKL